MSILPLSLIIELLVDLVNLNKMAATSSTVSTTTAPAPTPTPSSPETPASANKLSITPLAVSSPPWSSSSRATIAASSSDKNDGDIKAVIFDLGGTLKYQRDKRKVKEEKNGRLADWVVKHFATSTAAAPTVSSSSSVPAASSMTPPTTEDKRGDAAGAPTVTASSSSSSSSDQRTAFIHEWREMLRAWKREKRVSKLVLAEKPADVILKQCLIRLFGDHNVALHWTDETAKAALDTYFQAELAASTLFPGVMDMLQALQSDVSALRHINYYSNHAMLTLISTIGTQIGIGD
jgi:phosphoglycolate phosphatase-like HAD superfamily hydrolase